MRKLMNINDGWRFKKGAYTPDSLPCDWESVTLPHTWNAIDGQDGGNDYWRGTATYCREMDMPALEKGGRAVLEFNGAAMCADVYVNGEHVLRHEGGYSAFRADITDLLKDRNLLTVQVDNSPSDKIYPQRADFTFYGGLYRSVNLITVPEKHFELIKDGTPGIKVTPKVTGKDAEVLAEAWVSGHGEVSFTINGETKTVRAEDGHAEARFTIKDARLWDGLNDPYLYTAQAEFGGDSVSCQFGCRAIGFDPEKGFMLNGKPYPLRGVCRHQDREGLGNAITLKEHEEDLSLILEMGANTVRLAHYQHAQEFLDLCDRNGMTVWAEIPCISKHALEASENAVSQMRELVTQCYNHPSVICWGLSNEITIAGGAVDDALLETHRRLHDLCRRMDATRPTVMAHAFMLDMASPLIPIAELASYNLYFGWYVDGLNKNEEFLDRYHSLYPDRCIGLSEYGADANLRFQAEEPQRGDYSEGYQCVYHEHLLNCIEHRPYLWATHVWNMFDFAADGRNEGGRPGVNQKGLVSFDRKTRKDAFYLYKAAWGKEPFVHLCGRRYVNREHETTQVKVYSNCGEVTLLVNGAELETKRGKRVFNFSVTGKGKTEITARAGSLSDSMTIELGTKLNTDYLLNGEPLVNWIDKEAFNEDCYSIRDTMGELAENAEAKALSEAIMAKARASRGDVATLTSENEELKRILSGTSLETLLRQAGPAIKAEEVKELNAALQKIKK